MGLLIAAPLAGGGSARAAFPGENGGIAFATFRDGNFEIYVMNADGTSQTRIRFTLTDDRFPDWQPILLPSPSCSTGGVTGDGTLAYNLLGTQDESGTISSELHGAEPALSALAAAGARGELPCGDRRAIERPTPHRAEGIPGECNVGRLNSWSATVTVYGAKTAAVAASSADPALGPRVVKSG